MSGMQGRPRRIACSGFLLGALLAVVLASVSGGAPGDTTASQVADIRPGGQSSTPDSLFNAGGTLLFGADDGVNGTELWKSNGGPLGPGGTEMIEIASGSQPSSPTEFADVGGTVFFGASDGVAHGSELWKIAPPFTSPTMVEDINPTSQSFPTDLVNAGGTLLFSADDGTNGRELWKSTMPYDADSTSLVENINTAMSTGSSPNQLFNVNGTVFFDADDGTGDELWKSVSPYNSISTTKVDVNPSGASFPGPFAEINGTLFFAADDDSEDDFGLFKLPPPYTTPTQVKDINPDGDDDVSGLVNVNDILFFIANDGSDLGEHGEEVWKSVAPYDAASTTVLDINPGISSSDPFGLAKIGGTLFLRADDGTNGAELWKSNGGPVGAGTEMVADIVPGSAGSSPFGFEDVGGMAFFGANEPVTGQELWRSSGVGATPVADIFSGDSGSAPSQLTNVAGTLFLQANDGLTGQELWKVTIEPAAPLLAPPPLPSNAFTVGKLKGKKLSLSVSAAGVASVDDQGAQAAGGRAVASAKKNLLKRSSASGGPGTIVVKLKLTKSALRTLNEKGKLKLKTQITFTPTGGVANTQTAKLKIKK